MSKGAVVPHLFVLPYTIKNCENLKVVSVLHLSTIPLLKIKVIFITSL